jgi:hypothetical protein
MTDDLLPRAARALRDAHDGTSHRADETADRILSAARVRARAGRKVIAVALAFAAMLALTAAWAATTGRLARLVRWMGASPPSSPSGMAASVGVPPPAPTPVEEGAADAATDAPSPDPTPALPEPTVHPAPLAPVRSHAAPPVEAVSDAGDAPDREGELYAVAHRAHFVTRDAAAALRAWDAYLDAFPDGRFALEARYNRALSLVRLGRTGEARQALTPFASGGAGGYRQREARELLDALGP